MNREDKIKADIARLQNELEQIEKAKKAPQPLAIIDVDKIKSCVVAHIEEIATNGCANDDDPHFIFEAAVEAVYGKDIWKWYNKTNKG